MALIGLLLIPLLVGGIAFFVFHATITWKEFLLQIAVCVSIALLGWWIAKWGSISSTEFLHGRITNKIQGTQGCCHCTTTCVSTDKDGNCTAHVTTCDHINDYYYTLDTTVGRIGISDCDDTRPPKVWDEAIVGEPAVIANSYKNYLKADKNSLLIHTDLNRYYEQIPEYPRIYNRYKLNSVISNDVEIPDFWQYELKQINADLGSEKQVDITVLLTRISDPRYAQAVESKWLYGPKNSLNIILGINNDNTIKSARVVTISKVESLKIKLRDTLPGKNINNPEILRIIKNTVQTEFKRTPMAQFEYLAKSMEPSAGWIIFLYILNLLIACGICYFMHVNDLFGDERRKRWY